MGSSQQDVVPQPVRARRYLWGLAIALAVACMVAVGEINAQSGRIVDDQGRAWPLSVLVGPGWIERGAGWPEVLTSLINDPLYRALLSWFLVINVVFIVCYAAVLAGLVAALFRTSRARIAIWALVAILVLADLVENLCILVLMITSSPSGPVGLLWWCTTAKWVLLVLVAAILLLRFVVPQSKPEGGNGGVNSPKAVVVRSLRALMHHRFSVAMIIPLAVLTMLSGSAILEQLPDVQRQWVSNGLQGWLQAGCAVIALLGVGFLLEALGRFRTGWAVRHQINPANPGSRTAPTSTTQKPENPGKPENSRVPKKPWVRPLIRRLLDDLLLILRLLVELVTNPRRLAARLHHLAGKGDALLSLWLLGIAIPVVSALIARVFMPPANLLSTRLLVFCAVPLVVVVVSWVLRRAWQIREDWYIPDRPPEFTAQEVSLIRFIGRALALTAVTVGGIGLIRSFLSVVALGPEVTGVGLGLSVLFLVIGIAAVVLPWVISWAFVAGEVPDPMASMGSTAPARLARRWALLGGVLALFLAISVFPGQAAYAGVSAVTITSLTLLIGIAASAGLLIQERPTAEIFRLLGLRRTPLVSVLVLAIVLAGLTVGGSTIHQVVDTPAQDSPRRPPVGDMVQTWLKQSGGCEVDVNGQRARPMIMVAAEGGGIRAAYWTVKGLAALDTETGGCGAHSVLFSGGASGGSTGLTVARFSGTPSDPGTGRAVEAVKAMAEPDTLAQAVIGTFVRDPLYAATGVPLGSSGVAPAGTWADRARLIELGWDRSAVGQPWGTQPFLSADSTLSPATGPLVINSSSVASQCRVWVSQLDLEQPAASDGEQQCDHQVSPGARTVDLFAAYGPAGGTGDHCLGTITASTAALLTARFPYVTPGGVVGGCDVDESQNGFWPRTQLIDGGYIENTGLATVTDLSAQWLAQVRGHNEDVVAGRSNEPLIIPFVVFLTNEQATAGRLTEPPALQSELLLPAVGYLRGSATLTRTDALLQRVSTTVRTRSICPPSQKDQVDCDAILAAFPRRVIVVDRTAQPEVTAPLGWVLSKASMTGLDRAMEHQVQTTCTDGATDPSCLRGYGTLGDLLGYLRR